MRRSPKDSAIFAEKSPMAACRSAISSHAPLRIATTSFTIRYVWCCGCAFLMMGGDCGGCTQACLDKFFRSNKLDKSRKTGFKCPRGCGKDSAFSSPCPGRVGSDHPMQLALIYSLIYSHRLMA